MFPPGNVLPNNQKGGNPQCVEIETSPRETLGPKGKRGPPFSAGGNTRGFLNNFAPKFPKDSGENSRVNPPHTNSPITGDFPPGISSKMRPPFLNHKGQFHPKKGISSIPCAAFPIKKMGTQALPGGKSSKIRKKAPRIVGRLRTPLTTGLKVNSL